MAVFAAALILSACQPAVQAAPQAQPTPQATLQVTPSPTQFVLAGSPVSFSPAAPKLLREKFAEAGMQISDTKTSLYVDVVNSVPDAYYVSRWTYALVAPFPTILDNVTTDELTSAWKGENERFAGIPLLLDESTKATFSALWGEPASNAVQVIPADKLLDTAWNQMPAWAIIPFEQIEPKWKVLMIDGQSPIQKSFKPESYPLIAHYLLTCDACELPAEPNLSYVNYDQSKVTTVILTGVTALVRAIADRMEHKGVLYPGEAIRDLLREADITHINNEVPFYGGCPKPDPNQGKQIFCSAPRYIELFTDVGADVIELSGDHFADYHEVAMYQTLDLYKQYNFAYYGGGYNIEDGRKPLFMEVNGNKVMFIGCNYKDIYASARENVPGSVICDFDYMTEQIRKYRAEGWLPISTFQYHEFMRPEATPQQMIDFRRMADAGAVIVSGSQAHVPQAKEFYNGAFIDYGLGNLFFDQMQPTTRREFIDRHVFYEGKYLGVELITAYLTDYCRPVLMTESQRSKFLLDIFEAGGWAFPQIDTGN
jgi:poly-gamma-glutamate synthesis protein (capsule biosynthesis protein)